MSWFEGDAPRSEAESEFLIALRSHAEAWRLDVRPDDTAVRTVLVPLYVEVGVPELPWGDNQVTVLQAGYWGADPAGRVLEAEWGDTHLLDNGGHDDALSLGGLRLSPAEAAATLADWFAAQLQRPVQRDEWVSADGRVIAAEWRLSDTGRRLAADGAWLRRRRPPARTITVRNDQ